jgi:hypothetical protein
VRRRSAEKPANLGVIRGERRLEGAVAATAPRFHRRDRVRIGDRLARSLLFTAVALLQRWNRKGKASELQTAGAGERRASSFACGIETAGDGMDLVRSRYSSAIFCSGRRVSSPF